MEGESTLWPLFKKLFAPFPDALKRDKDGKYTFVEWVDYVIRAHQQFPEGYSKEVRYVQEIGGVNTLEDKKGNEILQDDRQLVVCVRITDNQSGSFQEALGTAYAGKGDSWGGAMAEAESQAFRRAMANWGLGLEMYLDDQTFDFYTHGTADEEEPDEEDAEEPEEDEDDDEEEEDEEDEDEDEDEDDEEESDEPTDRQIQVMSDIGKVLIEYAEEEDDGKLQSFLKRQRRLIEKTPTKETAGAIIRRFRKKLESLDLEDPTSEDSD